MFESCVDVPVLMLFFNRPNTFKSVFDQVKKARPSVLLLYQDGPREDHPDDIEKIEECRKIAEDIDWDCMVYRNYMEKNVGCDPSEYNSQKWAFSIVDRCIVLEDDAIPSVTFFQFCKELLEKYKDDTRINMICGFNYLGTYENCSTDYFFSKMRSIHGWASWKRVIDQWDPTYIFLDDVEAVEKVSKHFPSKTEWKKMITVFSNHKESGVEYYESILNINALTQSTLSITPKHSLITYNGLNGEGGTHSMNNLRLIPKSMRGLFEVQAAEMDFPMNEPKYVIEDLEYKNQVKWVMGSGHPFVSRYREIKSVFYRLIHGDLLGLIAGAKRRYKRW